MKRSSETESGVFALPRVHIDRGYNRTVTQDFYSGLLPSHRSQLAFQPASTQKLFHRKQDCGRHQPGWFSGLCARGPPAPDPHPAQAGPRRRLRHLDAPRQSGRNLAHHTAIVTGVDASEHQVLFNGLLTRPTAGTKPSIQPWRDKDILVHSPTVYDAAHDAGLTTAQVDWVAIYGAKTIAWQFPEIPDPNGAIERELIAAGTVTADQLSKFEDSSQVWQDQIWTDAAVDILEKHPPNLLLFHLLTLDDTNHESGPMNPASFTAMAYLDDKVKQILDTLERTGLSKTATVIVVSDHGFRSIKQKVHANVLLRQKGLQTGVPGKEKGDAWVVADGGIAVVYATDSDRKAALLPELRRIFTGAEGIDQVYGVEDFPGLGLPIPSTSDQAPDLVLTAQADYSFTGDPGQEFITHVASGGTHGFLNTDPQMQAIFIAWGATGFRKAFASAISPIWMLPLPSRLYSG